MRSTSSLVRFSNPFTLPGHSRVLPAGMYEVVGEEELLKGSDFQTFRRKETFLLVRGRDRRAGCGDRHRIAESDLAALLALDRDLSAGLIEHRAAPAGPSAHSGARSAG